MRGRPADSSVCSWLACTVHRPRSSAASSVRLLPELDVRVCESVKEAVKDAAIVCLATTSVTALVEDGDVRSDVHINAVGAYRPDMRELGVSVLAAANWCAQTIRTALFARLVT